MSENQYHDYETIRKERDEARQMLMFTAENAVSFMIAIGAAAHNAADGESALAFARALEEGIKQEMIKLTERLNAMTAAAKAQRAKESKEGEQNETV